MVISKQISISLTAPDIIFYLRDSELCNEFALPPTERDNEMSAYQCGACYYPYEEELGLPDEGIAPNTPWKDVPEDFICPECGTPKGGFINWIKD